MQSDKVLISDQVTCRQNGKRVSGWDVSDTRRHRRIVSVVASANPLRRARERVLVEDDLPTYRILKALAFVLKNRNLLHIGLRGAFLDIKIILRIVLEVASAKQ
jgi:hypothetical protein